eukprot:CAMPEP_0182496022 /NCGR_PEP_ID=MMETSP1321-20130603/4722_1 /TAXON_ID=91990 /ORGANISM="Bolidomonas sp., Strain RCC1657" /LENGTH=472 /DNA_ID=CAMNT_0024699523 /DNA_START=107 /DNA_END=1521 /DNA_ORIENTATION=-
MANKMGQISIVGGGVVGLTLLTRLARLLPSHTITLLDGAPRSAPLLSNSDTATQPTIRTYALNKASVETLSKCGLSIEESQRKGEYKSMQVWDSKTPSYLKFDVSDVGADAHSSLGVIVEDDYICGNLEKIASNLSNAKIVKGAQVKKVTSDSVSYSTPVDKTSSSSTSSSTSSSSTPNSLNSLDSDLIVGADGFNSTVRTSLNFPLTKISYGRTALISTVKADSDETVGTAWQRFFPGGPLALLPLWGGYYSIVWSTTNDHAEALAEASPSDFLSTVNECIGGGPTPIKFSDGSFLPPPLKSAKNLLDDLVGTMVNGISLINMNEKFGNSKRFEAPPMITELSSPRFRLPLNLQHVDTYHSSSVVLVGDAAHSVHPMAGQGLNLGIADVECLVKCIESSVTTGGAVDDEYALERYSNERRKEVLKMMGGIHALHHVFKEENDLVLTGRALGMSLLNMSGTAKRSLARAAMG